MVPVEESSAEAESGSIKPQSQPQVSTGMSQFTQILTL